MSVWTKIKDWLLKSVLDMKMPTATLVERIKNLDIDGDGNISVREVVQVFRDWLSGVRR